MTSQTNDRTQVFDIDYTVTSLNEHKIAIEVYDSYLERGRHHWMTLFKSRIDIDTVAKYTNSLAHHIGYVRKAGELLNVPSDQLLCHDDSKWTYEEFPHYAMNFHSAVSDDNKLTIKGNFAYAWLHHIHDNPHHWNHWVFPDSYRVEGVTDARGALPMPENYVREMIADWHGAGRAYQGHWDISEWLSDNEGRMILHPETERLIFEIMEEAGYRGLQSAGLGWEVGPHWAFKDLA